MTTADMSADPWPLGRDEVDSYRLYRKLPFSHQIGHKKFFFKSFLLDINSDRGSKMLSPRENSASSYVLLTTDKQTDRWISSTL